MTRHVGVAGRLAGAFIHSKLTPAFILASLLMGVYAVIALIGLALRRFRTAGAVEVSSILGG